MSIEILQEIFENADIFNYIKLSSHIDIYDECAKYTFDKLHKDLTIDQIQNIIWESFYSFVCVGKIGESFDQDFSLDKDQAKVILGSPERFKGMALNIRNLVFGI